MTSCKVSKFKLYPPNLKGTIARSRLIDLVRQAKDRKVVVLNAPAGSGKSTFVINYLQDSGIPFLWYNLDEGDSDPVTFFNLILDGVGQIAGRECPFPKFSPEQIPSIERYSEKLIETVFGISQTHKMALVLDNYQNISQDSLVHKAIEVFLKKSTLFEKLFILSRRPLPFAIRDWNLEKFILRLDWSHLKFSFDEFQQLLMLKAVTKLPKQDREELFRKTNGWVANIVLALSSGGILPNTDSMNYECWPSDFASLSSDEVSLLSKVAHLPEVTTSLAVKLTGSKQVVSILDRLAEEGFFVTHLQKGTPVYRIHDLFREYLRQEARRSIDPVSYKKHIKKVTSLLCEAGYYEEAFQSLMEVNAVEEIYDILGMNCLDWVNSGRLFTLKRCLEYLEGSQFTFLPWSLYGTGTLLKFHEPSKAIEFFKGALEGFKKDNEIIGIKAVIAELLDTAQYYGEDFSIVGLLLNEAERIMDQMPEEGPYVADAMLPGYAGILYLLHKGDSKKAVACFEKAQKIMSKMVGMEMFLSYVQIYAAIAYDSAGQVFKAEEIFRKASNIFERCPEYPPHKFMFHFLASIHEVFIGRFDHCVKRIQSFIEYSRDWGLYIHEEHLQIRLLEGLLCQEKLEDAQKVIEEIESLSMRSTFSRATTFELLAQKCLIEENYQEARLAAEQSILLFEKIKGEVFAEAAKSLLALALAGQGQFHEAQDILDGIIDEAKKRGNLMQVFTSLMHMAWIRYRHGDEDRAVSILQEALLLGKSSGFRATYHWYPSMMSSLLSLAMEHDIQTDYVASLVRYHCLMPSRQIMPSPEGWPWRVKVYSFGGLEVFIDGKQLDISRWQGKKALDLLKAILFLGGKECQLFTLMDILWPDSEGDKAKQNIEFTLRRLRNVLGLKHPSEAVLIVKAGMVSFNWKNSWVDVIAMRDYINISHRLSFQGDEYGAAYYKEKIISLYKGKFLETDNEPWIFNKQVQWHQRVMRIGEELLSFYKAHKIFDKLIIFARRILELEPASSRACHYLMEALISLGHPEEAIKTYKEFKAYGKAYGGQQASMNQLERLYQQLIS